MEHSAKFELVKNYYNDGLWKKKAVKNAVKREWITATEYEEITDGNIGRSEDDSVK